ncbi:hypothetical protein X474_11490 [Dethiosulfatarculus sandiegensis]|uniref:Uncharacterized protein n=1 Tax=Dethiosulfatarculus sandiegensis TaxID=1429043 RepID=A0A0D2J6R8_9BACT|nr:hypothetical protein X474_11490 [Dethiosulfatarculus sandiegensis]
MMTEPQKQQGHLKPLAVFLNPDPLHKTKAFYFETDLVSLPTERIQI